MRSRIFAIAASARRPSLVQLRLAFDAIGVDGL
jgi:hypothetical protein